MAPPHESEGVRVVASPAGVPDTVKRAGTTTGTAAVPAALHPKGGGAPPSRKEGKKEVLESIDWDAVITESEARAEAERPVEPRLGDILQHPTLGQLEVVDLELSRIEVRDRARNRRKLARQVLEFRYLGERGGRRVLRVTVRPP